MSDIFKICGLACALFLLPVIVSAQSQTQGDSAAQTSGCDASQEHFVSVSGVRVHYLEAGAGQTVVFVHGNAGSVDDFSYRAIRMLCGEFKILALDRPGHGKSERLSKDSARLESQARLLHDTLNLLGVKRPILVGHSWGGSLALAYALNYPNDVSSLVLLAPAAYTEDEPTGGWMTALIKPPVIGDVCLAAGKVLFGKRMLKRELGRAFDPQTVPADYLASTNTWLGRSQLKSYFEDERKLNVSLQSLSARYPDIRLPVIIVTGDSDKVVTPEANAYRLKAAIPQSQLLVLKHTGHEIPQTDPQSIRTALTMISTSTAAAR